MSRRQRTTLTLSVRVPLPAGWTQKRLVDELTTAVIAQLSATSIQHEIIVKIERREVQYL
jgi:hypothetical protein